MSGIIEGIVKNDSVTCAQQLAAFEDPETTSKDKQCKFLVHGLDKTVECNQLVVPAAA